MTAESLIAGLPVLLLGALIWATPALARPTLQFGVRVPGGRVGAAVIRRERHAYHWRTALLAVGFTAAAVLLADGPRWLSAVVLLLESAAGLGCFWLAREGISAAKSAEGWYEGLRQTVATDSSWRTEPERFPARWLLPAVAVAAATAVIGAVRYPGLPDRLAVHFTSAGAPDRWADKSVWSVFSLVVGQLFATALITGLMLVTYRSRPDIDAADAAASTHRYRRFLAAMTRGLLTLVALVNLSLLLAALEVWHVYRLTGLGAALPLLPVAVGVLILLSVAVRMGQAGSRLPGAAPTGGPSEGHDAQAAAVNRDDDRFWKAGLVYVNREDPALLVGKRFGVGWTFNFGNPKAWLLLAGIVVPAVALGVTGAAR